MREERVLIVGCGSVGKRHAGNLHALGVRDMMAYDPDDERVRSVVNGYGARACADLGEAYEASPDVVVVCAPTNLHLGLAREAVLKGCDVFVEKPLSHTLEGVDELLRLVKDRDRALMVGYNLRFDSCVRKTRQLLDEGRIGCVVSARLHFGSYLPWRHPEEDYRTGYGARGELGGGVILDAIHEIDYALWFFGRPEKVYCVSGKFSSLEIDTEDTAELLLSYKDRKVVSIHLDYVQRPYGRWCEVVGDKGMIRCDLSKGEVSVFDGDHREWGRLDCGEDANAQYVNEMKHFLGCVAGNETLLVDGDIARESLAVAVAAKRSAEERRALDLDSFLAATP